MTSPRPAEASRGPGAEARRMAAMTRRASEEARLGTTRRPKPVGATRHRSILLQAAEPHAGRSSRRTGRPPMCSSSSGSEDHALDRLRSPKTPSPGTAESGRSESDLACGASSSARSCRPSGRDRVGPHAEARGATAATRRAPEGARLGTATRPEPGDSTCLCATPLQAAALRVGRSDQSRRTHTCACSRVRARQRRLSSDRAARARRVQIGSHQ